MLYITNEIQNGVKGVLLQLTIILPPEYTQLSKRKNKSGTVLPTELKINSGGGEITLHILVTLEVGITLTAVAPQKWSLELPGSKPYFSPSCLDEL